MLLGNYTPLSANPGRCITHAIPNPYKWRSSGNMYSFYTGDAVVDNETEKSSFNNGYVPPYSWVLAPVAGGLASINEINGEGELDISSLALGKALAASLSGTGTISTSSLSLITSLAATLAGTGSVSASMVGAVSMAATLIGTGSVTAGLNLLANCIATLVGTGSVTADLKGKASLAATIYVNEGSADIQQMAEGVWNAVAADYNEAGTMGEKMNDAGSAGNPWTDTTDYGAGTKGKLLQDAADNSELGAIK